VQRLFSFERCGRSGPNGGPYEPLGLPAVALKSLPESLPAIIELFERIHPDRVAFTERAGKPAADARQPARHQSTGFRNAPLATRAKQFDAYGWADSIDA
jgi:hypothetical protein